MSTEAESHGATPPPDAADPSMEDILASIRRILDEEGKPAEVSPEHAMPKAETAIPGRSHVEEDVLDLEPSMMLPDETPGPVPPPPPILAEPVREPELPASTSAFPVPHPPAPAPATPIAMRGPDATLVAPAAAAAASASIGSLMRTLASERSTAVHRGGPTIEDLVREEIRPLAKEWLDTHLPALVERLVRAEIERVVSRMT